MALTPTEQVELEALQADRGTPSPKQSDDQTAFTPSNNWDYYKQKAGEGLGALGKLAAVLRNTTTGPLTAKALELATGKKAADMGQGYTDSLNPTNLKQFPSNAEMFEKAGVKNHALSEILPYAEPSRPGHKNPWYHIEKGGMLDPTVAGTLQVITDPAMYLGVGGIGEAANVLRASRIGAVGKAAEIAASPLTMVPKAIAKGVEMLPGGQYANTVLNPLSAATRAVGKKVYSSAVLPVEHEGERYGKKAVADTLYEAGASTPGNIEKQAQTGANALKSSRDEILNQASGQTVDIPAALAPGYARVRQLRDLGSPAANAEADSLKAELDGVLKTHVGTPPTPGEPPTVVTKVRHMVDESGDLVPISEHHEIIPGAPGDPGVPPLPYNPQDATRLKSYWGEQLSKSAHQAAPGAKIPAGDAGVRAAAGGVAREVENAVGAQGPALHDLNEKLGHLIGTKKSQQFVREKADREGANLIRGTGMDAVVAGAGTAVGGPVGAMTAVAGKKGLQGLFMGTMPAGYYTRKLGDANIIDRLNELVQQYKLKGAQNGKK